MSEQNWAFRHHLIAPETTPPPPMGGHNRIELPDSIINQLGMLADDKLAKIAGVSKKRIIRERHALRHFFLYTERTGNSGRYKTRNYQHDG